MPFARNDALKWTIILVLTTAAISGCSSSQDRPDAEGGELDYRMADVETRIAAQSTEIADIHEIQSYILTQTWDMAGRVPTRTPGTAVPTPYDTSTPEPASQVISREYYPAPDGERTAIVEGGTHLLVADAAGERELFAAEAIAGVSWFPNGRYLAIGRIMNQDRLQDQETQIWILDTQDGSARHFGGGFEPVVSPDGEYIAYKAGIPFSDACNVEYSLEVSRLDADLRETESITQSEFRGLPDQVQGAAFYPDGAGGSPSGFRWLDSDRLLAPMLWACRDAPDENGVYLLDVADRSASKYMNYPSMEGNPIPRFAPGHPPLLTSVDMITEREGWAKGGILGASNHVFHTDDGGESWIDVTPHEPNLTGDPAEKSATAAFFDGQRAWVAYAPTDQDQVKGLNLWRTSDGGGTWEASRLRCASGFCPFMQPLSLVFTTPEQGWAMVAVDAGMSHVYVELHHTSDGGANWETLIRPPGDADSGNLHVHSQTGMDFFGSETGLVTFSRGPQEAMMVDWTTDGGRSWESRHLPPPPDCPGPECFNGVACKSDDPMLFSPDAAVLAVECVTEPQSISSSTQSYLYSTDDGGRTWDVSPFPGGAMTFINRSIGWALEGGIYQTLDGGESWVMKADPPWQGQFDFISAQKGWAVAEIQGRIEVLYTDDGGATWTELQAVTGP